MGTWVLEKIGVEVQYLGNTSKKLWCKHFGSEATKRIEMGFRI